MPATELSGPLPPEQFTQTLYSRHHGTEVGIRGDTDGSAFGITLPPSGDEATFGSATVDSICKVGGYPLIIPKTTPHSLEIPPALTGGTTGRTDLVVARYAPATYTTAPGPVRLARIEGTPGSLTVPAYDPETELPLWSVRRKQGEALNQAIPGDLRSWTGVPVLVKSGAPLPIAQLGARATRDGITWRMDFVGGGVDWVQENWLIETRTGEDATKSSASGWAREDGCYLVRDGKRRWLHMVSRRGVGQPDITSSGSGNLDDILIAELWTEDRPPTGTSVTAAGRVRALGGGTFAATGHLTSVGNLYLNWMAPNLTIGASGPDDTLRLDLNWYVA